jgi:hypothetical protein
LDLQLDEIVKQILKVHQDYSSINFSSTMQDKPSKVLELCLFQKCHGGIPITFCSLSYYSILGMLRIK